MHTLSIPSSGSIFVYRLVTSIETRIALVGTFLSFFSMKLISPSESLRFDSCSFAMG